VDGGIVIAAASGTYSENVAMGYGGSIMAQEASIRFEDIEFKDNISHENGGAIAVNRSIVQIAGTIFDVNDGLIGNGDALYIADDLDGQIDGTYVFCDPSVPVSFCYGFDEGTAIYEIPGGLHSNTNCQEVGLSDIFSKQCPNYIP
jgi:predicted outer membrane repeat protein